MPTGYIFRTGLDGCGCFREVEASKVATLIQTATPEDPAVKKAFVTADYHYPPSGRVMIIRIERGKHTLKVWTSTGEKMVGLYPGDSAVFCDHQPPEEPRQGKSGHASVAGPMGVTIYRWSVSISEVASAAEFSWLGLQ